jgi:hypothetical protein
VGKRIIVKEIDIGGKITSNQQSLPPFKVFKKGRENNAKAIGP